MPRAEPAASEPSRRNEAAPERRLRAVWYMRDPRQVPAMGGSINAYPWRVEPEQGRLARVRGDRVELEFPDGRLLEVPRADCILEFER